MLGFIFLALFQIHLGEPRQYCELKSIYDGLNERYFGGRLPTENVHIVWSESIERDGDIAGTWITRFENEPETILVLISTRMRGCGICMQNLLLHEMAHIKLRGRNVDHGRAFDKEMLRLVKIGAYRW